MTYETFKPNEIPKYALLQTTLLYNTGRFASKYYSEFYVVILNNDQPDDEIIDFIINETSGIFACSLLLGRYLFEDINEALMFKMRFG